MFRRSSCTKSKHHSGEDVESTGLRLESDRNVWKCSSPTLIYFERNRLPGQETAEYPAYAEYYASMPQGLTLATCQRENVNCALEEAEGPILARTEQGECLLVSFPLLDSLYPIHEARQQKRISHAEGKNGVSNFIASNGTTVIQYEHSYLTLSEESWGSLASQYSVHMAFRRTDASLCLEPYACRPASKHGTYPRLLYGYERDRDLSSFQLAAHFPASKSWKCETEVENIFCANAQHGKYYKWCVSIMAFLS
jgi:hypothetical protein